MQRFTNFDQCVDYVTTRLHRTNLKLRKNDASFNHSVALLHALHDPQDAVPAIHIAATSGKGSIGYAIEAILRAHDLTTSLITSPHAYDIRERIRENGQLISKARFVALANDFMQGIAGTNLEPSYFEAMMTMGFLAGATRHPDYAIVETGLGGLWDTSNTITRHDKLAVVGSIGFDHMHILGNTLQEIAYQKAGIMPHHGAAIVLSQASDINDVFTQVAHERQTRLVWVEPAQSAYETNWLMAQTATQYIAARDGWRYSQTVAAEAIANITAPARFEVRTINQRLVILDAAHNPQKAGALVEWLGTNYPGQTFTTIIAISEGKDADAIIQTLRAVTNQYIATAFFTDQQDMPVHAMSATELAKIIAARAPDAPLTTYDRAKEALAHGLATQQPLLITGSFYLVGEIGLMLRDNLSDVLT